MRPHEPINKVRVLFVTASTKGGGAERMLFNIIRSLDSKHTAKLFVTSNDKVPDLYAAEVDTVYARKRHAINAFMPLLRELRDFRPHHVFTTSSNIGYMIIIAKKLLKAHYKTYIRCAVPPSEIYQTDIKTRLLNWVISKTYNSANLIIAQTDYSRDDLIKCYNIEPSKVKTIRNIVDTKLVTTQAENSTPLELNTNNYNIVAAGALYSVKGFDLLIEAIAPLLRGTNRHLYILGEERYETGYKSLLLNKINEAGVKAQIHLLGQKSNPYPYYKAADLFVMSSRKEGFPNVVLEALTLGTPVVATNVVDWSEVIKDGHNGLIANKNNVDSLRSVLERAFITKFDTLKIKFTNYNYNELFS